MIEVGNVVKVLASKNFLIPFLDELDNSKTFEPYLFFPSNWQHCQAEKSFSGEGVANLLAMLPTKKLATPSRPDDSGHCQANG